MIDFACKRFDLEEVIRCSLNLTKTEFKIMEYLIKQNRKCFTTQEISKIFGIGLSTAQKSVRKIKEAEIVKRGQKNFKGGGYVFIYSINQKRVLKEKILRIIRNWTEKVEDRIQEW